MKCTRPKRLQNFWITCGHCLPCKMRKRAAWTLRMLHHTQTNPDAVFLTMTYNEDQVCRRGNGTGMLVKNDVVKFFKRLRINRWRAGRTGDVSHFSVGEYGDRTDRPHYHSIVWGLKYNFVDREDVERAWHHGAVHFGLVTPESVRYVAGYLDKKILGYKAVYEGREAEFQLASNGLGLDWLKGNLDKVLYDAALSFEGRLTPVFKYYRDHMKELVPAKYDGYIQRVMALSSIAEENLMQELSGAFAPTQYDDLTAQQQLSVASAIHERNTIYAAELEQSLLFKRLENKNKENRI